MGGIFSSEGSQDDIFSLQNCTQLDDRTAFLLLKNYIQLSRMKSIFIKIQNDQQEYNKMINDYTFYLIDSQAMTDMLKEIPEDIRNNFAPITQKIIGKQGGTPLLQDISVYDVYNDFFINELLNFGQNRDKTLERIKQLIDILDTKTSIVLNLMNNMCI